MADHVRLLPPENETPFLAALSSAIDPWAELADIFAEIPSLDMHPPPQMLPFLAWERGLGEISVYVPNLYDLIDRGTRWQRIRGTWGAVLLALGWVGYAGTLEEAPITRRRWNQFQIALDRVRDADAPDLDRIENVVRLSVPLRSQFWRGFNGYDLRVAEASKSRTSASIFSTDSGVRMHEGGPLWSFGREYGTEVSLTADELTTLGTFIPPVTSSPLWVDLDVPWVTADYLWAVPAEQARRDTIAGNLIARGWWICLRDAAGAVIGYRRAVAHRVSEAVSGPYRVGTTTLKVDDGSPTGIIVQATTGFGDGAGQHAASASVVIGAATANPTKPGRLWLGPDDLGGGVEVAASPIAIDLGATVRERIRFLLRF